MWDKRRLRRSSKLWDQIQITPREVVTIRHEKGCRDRPGRINIIVWINSFFELRCYVAMLWFSRVRLSWWFSISFSLTTIEYRKIKSLHTLATLATLSLAHISSLNHQQNNSLANEKQYSQIS
jgi:hypothetical protein